MSDDQKKSDRPNIHTSYVGEFKADSLKIEGGVASATFVDKGGAERVVKGYNDNAKLLEEAVAAGGEQIIRGSLLGGNKNPHMGIYGVGPDQVCGVVSHVRDNFDSFEKDGKQPYIDMFVKFERGEHTIGRPIKAYGDDALALEGLKDGDTIDVPARPTQEQRGKGDEKTWQSVMRITGPGTFERAAEKDTAPDPA